MRALITYGILLAGFTSMAQVMNNGAQFHTEEGSIVSVKEMDFINDGEVTHSGYLHVDSSIINELTWYCDTLVKSTVTLGKHWENNDGFESGIGEFLFIGNTQLIGGRDHSTFNDIKLLGRQYALKTMGNDIEVKRLLDLNNAELACNNHTALMNDTSQEIKRQDGFVSTQIYGRLNRELPNGFNTSSLFPLGYNDKGKIVYKPIVLKESNGDLFKTAFLYEDPNAYGLSRDQLQDSLCTVNDEYFHVIGSDSESMVDFIIITEEDDEWSRLADWKNQWVKMSSSGRRVLGVQDGHGDENYRLDVDRAVALASEAPFVETPEKLIYVPYKESVTLEPNYFMPENSSVTWTPPDHLDCEDCPDPVYTAGLPNSYLVEVDNGFGCKAYDTLRIEVIRGKDNPILIPNAFSPNGDMLNEIFRPHLYSFEELVSLKIYNRWGELIYEGTDGWDGTYMDKPVQMGAYMYMAEIRELIKGGYRRSNFVSGMVNVIR
jgi:gliding motility-associated-like protein